MISRCHTDRMEYDIMYIIRQSLTGQASSLVVTQKSHEVHLVICVNSKGLDLIGFETTISVEKVKGQVTTENDLTDLTSELIQNKKVMYVQFKFGENPDLHSKVI